MRRAVPHLLGKGLLIQLQNGLGGREARLQPARALLRLGMELLGGQCVEQTLDRLQHRVRAAAQCAPPLGSQRRLGLCGFCRLKIAQVGQAAQAVMDACASAVRVVFRSPPVGDGVHA